VLVKDAATEPEWATMAAAGHEPRDAGREPMTCSLMRIAIKA
jgi:hypothetical protein